MGVSIIIGCICQKYDKESGKNLRWNQCVKQNKNELHTVLEAAKESFIVMKKITNT